MALVVGKKQIGPLALINSVDTYSLVAVPAVPELDKPLIPESMDYVVKRTHNM